MLTKILRNNKAAIAGVTLIELAVAIFIGGIAISGLVTAYIDGLTAWQKASDKMLIYSEGSAVLSQITRFARRAGNIQTYTGINVPSHRMDLSIPVKVGKTVFYRGAEFYYYSFDGSLRWNNMTGMFDGFNQKLLPMSSFHSRPGETPYLEIQEASFTPVVPRNESPNSSDCISVLIKLVLNDAHGDTITLSSIVTKRNPPK